MVGLRFADMWVRRTEFLDFTSLTVDEFQILIPPFEAAFQAHMRLWCLDGTPRTNRRFSVYRTCPLATPEDRLFFLLTYLKTYAVQVVQGRLFGMSQSKANQWIHVLLPALLAALRGLGDAPAAPSRLWRTSCLSRKGRSWSRRWRSPPQPLHPELGKTPPLLLMTARNGALSAPRTLLNRRTVTVARKRTIR